MDQKIVLQENDREMNDLNITQLESAINGSPDNIHLNRTGKKPVLKVRDFQNRN
jgi:hypothetical protein